MLDGSHASHAFFELLLGVAVGLIDTLGGLTQVVKLAQLVSYPREHSRNGPSDRVLTIRNYAQDGHRKRRCDLLKQRYESLFWGHGTDTGIVYDKEVSISSKESILCQLETPGYFAAPGLLAPCTKLLAERSFREEF
jgi:hypothetical protein